MNKGGNGQTKYCLQSEKHPLQTTLALCSLMEHQSLVDVAICCGNNILHAHKVVLAANSALFREELEKNASVEQVVITGCDFSVVRCLVEFMYCGETVVPDEHLKYLVAAARTLQMKTLENLSFDYPLTGDMVVIPKPQFLSKKPKYPAYPFNTAPVSPSIMKPINYSLSNLYKPHKVKRKFRIEAEHQACVKEAQASRLAIANLKKEIASAPQANTFIIEETCTETTVENFIPHPSVGFGDGQVFLPTDPKIQNNVIQLTIPNSSEELTADKIKDILGNEANSNVEIMFKTSDGSFVTVTDEVLQNLQKDGLQYQVIDEDGRLGEVQELQLTKDKIDGAPKSGPLIPETFDLFGAAQTDSEDITIEPCKVMDQDSSLINPKNVEILSLDAEDLKSPFNITPIGNDSYSTENDLLTIYAEKETDQLKNEIQMMDEKGNLTSTVNASPKANSSLKFSPDMFFADMIGEGSTTRNKRICLDDDNSNNCLE
ncbi:unnamed protein product [Callosobruchus maculatus]|uniref:BTB domain-containing protein n=1 Tax=Callosobruchus maculatus TaxID=64391 RepID=A0A653DEN5_CALMS|nr:unnamed protein product [Callosobruchus maculatus]